jgi:transcriptional regulator with PAS, ATPase and Fis domain
LGFIVEIFTAVDQGLFRRDLYLRLNDLSLRIPALRERQQDILLLATSILKRLSRASGRTTRQLGDGVMKALLGLRLAGKRRQTVKLH